MARGPVDGEPVALVRRPAAMPTTIRLPGRIHRPYRRAVLPILLLALTALLAGCGSFPAVASLAPDLGTGPLLTYTVRGGECPDGACGGTTVIERDGRIHQTEPEVADLGRVPEAALAALDAAVTTADFEVIKARPFTGECPVNVDGQEQIFEFGAPGGVERIATCDVEVDPEHPLFVAASAALAAAGAP